MDSLKTLPSHLRTRVSGGAYTDAPGARLGRTGIPAPRPEGRYVVYWMRTAVRGHENPALDVARWTAASLGLPVFVYHALSERYPYASDRHHRFILEGARDVESELADLGVGYAFHLERPHHRGPHLRTLAREAALVVTEDMPVAPLTRWTAALAREVPVWAVDTACLVPMREVEPDSTTRAFRFRDATRPLRKTWLERPWPELTAPEPGGAGEAARDGARPGGGRGTGISVPFAASVGTPFLPHLPFDPIPLGEADLAALIAECEIDHAVGPVPHTPGGSRAGYARWTEFRDGRLTRYAWDRNDALKPGVSRMSAYLHYGHVSPFRIAREAAAVGGKGGTKYLDELLVWRELAYAFCAHHPEYGTLGGLPDWARESLATHEGDERRILSWERMARGRTGDGLWDAAQRSLLTHGELHNNVRMTWGKAVLGWTRDAEAALERMVDLNHRYALDGRDPASYGGLLWCLGQFDRPFSPERPVFGKVRSRSTSYHARRLDVGEYTRRVARPAWKEAPAVAVVGAGLAGLTAARVLADHGLEVHVFDKGRRPGGRANTREHGEHRFDHGAQFFTVRDPRVEKYLGSWIQEGVVSEWTGHLVRVAGGAMEGAKPGPRYVAVPGMVDLAGHLATDLSVTCGVRIASVAREEDGWRLADEQGRDVGRFDQVVVAVPAPQAVPLLGDAPGLRAAAEAVEMAPCWAGMFAFPTPLELGFDGAFVDGGAFSWVARDSSKPDRPDGERWVVHATPDWTRARLALDRDEAAQRLLSAFRDWCADLPGEGGAGPGSTSRDAASIPEPVFARAHRWGYALAPGPLPGGCLHDPVLGIGACGDWCRGGRVEGALLSGMAVAGRILGGAEAVPGNPLGHPQPEPRKSLQGELGL